jgi:hypothetical protein
MCRSFKYLFLFLFQFIFYISPGQISHNDSLKLKDHDSSLVSGRRQILPAILITGGVLIESVNIKKQIQGWFPRTGTAIDDYLRGVPVSELYLYDIFSNRHRNNVFNQTKYLIISRLATRYITQAIKRISNETRPNGGTLSFPSGHTSEAFTSATVLFRETIDFNPYIAYSGYVFATATGVLRITNNKHWISDVLAGAGIGMLVTNLVYYIEPFKKIDPFRLTKKAQIVPDIDPVSGLFCIRLYIDLN